MKIVIIVDKINHIIIELREEEVSDVGQKWDTFLEVCAFQIPLYHPEPSLLLMMLLCFLSLKSSPHSSMLTVLRVAKESVLSLVDLQRWSTCVEEAPHFRCEHGCCRAASSLLLLFFWIMLPGVRRACCALLWPWPWNIPSSSISMRLILSQFGFCYP